MTKNMLCSFSDAEGGWHAKEEAIVPLGVSCFERAKKRKAVGIEGEAQEKREEGA
jgi:hypothetical protein